MFTSRLSQSTRAKKKRSRRSRNRELKNNNLSGVTGVWFNSHRQKWIAQITFNGYTFNLGAYKDKDRAIEEREKAEKALKFYK